MRIEFSSARKEIHAELGSACTRPSLNFDDTSTARRQPTAAWGAVSGLVANTPPGSRCREGGVLVFNACSTD